MGNLLVRKVLLLLAIVSVAVLAAVSNAYAYQPVPPISTTINGVAFTITPIHHPTPTQLWNIPHSGRGGCVKVTFHLDSQGRPTRLQIDTSYPKSVFDHEVIHIFAKWQYRVTKGKGEPATAPPTLELSYVVPFVGSGAAGTTAELVDTEFLDWDCAQPHPRTLIVTQAAATASQSLRILPDDKKQQYKKKHVDRILLAVPQDTALPSGWVNAIFCISAKGKPVHAKVTKSSPRGLYNKAAVAALKTWPFIARKQDGYKVGTCRLKEHIPVYGADFLAKQPVVLSQRPTALQSADLWPKGKHVPSSGKVTLTFCVEADGSVNHVKVTQAKPSAVFDEAARKVLTVWQYWPRMTNGKSVATCNVQTSIRFRHTHRRLLWAESAP